MKLASIVGFCLVLISHMVFAEDAQPTNPPIAPPVGIYTFKGHLFPKLIKKSKLLNHNKEADQDEIASLKNQGFLCYRRTQQQTICYTKPPFTSFPDGFLEKTGKLMEKYPIEFPKEYQVDFSHNGSTTKEWMVYGELKIGEKKLHVYRITRDYEGAVSLSFPVDDENTIGMLYYHENLGFGFPLTARRTDKEGWTYNYYFEAIYEH